MSKPALHIEPEYRSQLERDAAATLTEAGVPFTYEGDWVRYLVPEFEAKYKPDFTFAGCPIIIEPKGRFGGATNNRRTGGREAAVKERQKFILLKEQHPELDIRFIFSRAKTPIYKGSKTTYAKWADDHGFKWAEKVVPPAWIEEIKAYLKPSKRK